VNVTIGIVGLAKLRAALNKLNRVEKEIGKAVIWGSREMHSRAVEVTPVDTGVLKASQRVRVDIPQMRGRIFIDPAVTNPMRWNRRPAVYGAQLHAQGLRPGRMPGTVRAFYLHAVQTHGYDIGKGMLDKIYRGLPK
jgi:hypothetical protein